MSLVTLFKKFCCTILNQRTFTTKSSFNSYCSFFLYPIFYTWFGRYNGYSLSWSQFCHSIACISIKHLYSYSHVTAFCFPFLTTLAWLYFIVLTSSPGMDQRSCLRKLLPKAEQPRPQSKYFLVIVDIEFKSGKLGFLHYNSCHIFLPNILQEKEKLIPFHIGVERPGYHNYSAIEIISKNMTP